MKRIPGIPTRKLIPLRPAKAEKRGIRASRRVRKSNVPDPQF